jgi:hypothetical protein
VPSPRREAWPRSCRWHLQVDLLSLVRPHARLHEGLAQATEHALVALRVDKPAQRYATGEQQGSTVRRGPLLEQHPTQVQLLTRLRPAAARHVTQALGGLSFSPSVDLGLDSAGLVPA